jgi:hypothetical protein
MSGTTEYPRIEDSWVWPDSVERLFRKQAEGRTLHVCCGKSDVGHVRIDRDPLNEPDIVADMNSLPVPDRAFDTVIADPPWNGIQKVGEKHTLFFELVRKAKLDGLILWNALTLPSSEQVDLEGCWVRQDFEEGKASVIGKYRRYPGQQTLTNGEEERGDGA